MKRIINKWYHFTDKVFEENTNSIVCGVLLLIALALIAVQVFSHIGNTFIIK